MPFTFSHPAIVLPLKELFKNKVSLTGLVIGSLTPDFEYFIFMKIHSVWGHHPLGVLYFDLPIGLILCFLFHLIIKKPLINNTPIFIQKHLIELKHSNWNKYFSKNWLVVVLSVIVGAYSHILWDAFTHQNAYFVNLLHLDQSLPIINIPIFKLLQHLSTIVGAYFIIKYVRKTKVSKIEVEPVNFIYWFKIIGISALILLLRVFFDTDIPFGNIIVSGITGLMLSILFVSFFELKNKQN